MEDSGLQAGVVGGENARAGMQTTFPSSCRDPSVKRTVCRGCFSLLLPGLTCTQRQRRCRGQRWTVQTCLTCQRSQRFLNDPGHVLWGDRPEAQLGSQADSKPPQSLPNTAHLIEEKVLPQSSNNQ
ncbi:ribonuclease P/MRP subunit p21 [Phyllostomus discolor]|uniref:Ribonuclease P/MRP subunit p21 n=1 Tax=Phyllostomus discolor TaxID=89673 RepID=A0A834AU15_9CHIR|nr:ribonuclease P/MRP subunit p21 [Phyllostomus discolor]